MNVKINKYNSKINLIFYNSKFKSKKIKIYIDIFKTYIIYALNYKYYN